MIYNPKSSRLNNWNYSNTGTYFITICTLNKKNFFGKINGNVMELSPRGIIAKNELLKTISIRKNIGIDPWVIMPNHIHLLIIIRDRLVETHGNASNNQNILNKYISENPINTNNYLNIFNLNETHYHASLHGQSNQSNIIHSHSNHPDFFEDINLKSIQTIPQTIKSFKGAVKRICKQKNLFFSWQSRYHDIIIKDKKQFYTVKKYIINNPFNCQKDKFYN